MSTNWQASAPGKVILFGEHAVVYGKKGIASAVGLRTTSTLVKTSNESFKINRTHPLPTVEIPLTLLKNLADENFNLQTVDLSKVVDQILDETFLTKIKDAVLSHMNLDLKTDLGALSVLSALLILFPISDEGWQLTTESTIPVGAGLGSSAAFHVSVSGAFLKASPRVEQLDDEKWKFWTNQLAFSMEKIVHGMGASGIDNLVSTYGGMVSYRKGVDPVFYSTDSLPTINVLITNTNVERNTKHLIGVVRSYYELFPDVSEHILMAIENISSYFENIIAKPETYNHENVEKLFSVNHQILASMGVSHISLERLRQELSVKFQLHTKLTGAGGGGCAITLLPNLLSPEYLSKISQTVERLEEFSFRCYHTNIGESGVYAKPV